MKNNKRFLGSVLFVLVVFFAAGIVWAIMDQPYNRPDPLMDYVAQDLGMFDTVYQELSEADCRGCHIDPHDPGDCMTSGCHSWDNTKDSSDPEFHGWHHWTEESGSRNCVACHDSNLIGAYTAPVSFEDDPPGVVPPTPFTCENCHWHQDVTTGHPSTYDGGDLHEYGKAIWHQYYNHHKSFYGNVAWGNCEMCHGDPLNWAEDDPEIIRACESCHTKETLHNIHCQDYSGWEALGFHVPISNTDPTDVDPTVYRTFTQNEMCSSCHASGFPAGSFIVKQVIVYGGFLDKTQDGVLVDTLITVTHRSNQPLPVKIKVYDKYGALVAVSSLLGGGVPLEDGNVPARGYGWITLGVVVNRATGNNGSQGLEKFSFKIATGKLDAVLKPAFIEVKQVIYNSRQQKPGAAIWNPANIAKWSETALGGKRGTGLVTYPGSWGQ